MAILCGSKRFHLSNITGSLNSEKIKLKSGALKFCHSVQIIKASAPFNVASLVLINKRPLRFRGSTMTKVMLFPAVVRKSPWTNARQSVQLFKTEGV